MAKNDFDSLGFKPITKEQLSDIGFRPSEPDIAPPVYTESPGMVESGLRGLEQGATLGFGDEINSALSTLLNKATGQATPGLGILDEYRKQLEESRGAFKAAEEAHPYISGAANLAGGIAPALLTGGGSLAEQGLVGAAKMGAKYGALGGLGTSEADLTKGDVGGALKDAATGGVMGGVLGGALHVGAEKFGDTLKNAGMAIGGAGKSLLKTPLELPFIQEPLEAFSLGLKGEKLYGSEAARALQQRAIGAKEDIASTLAQGGKDAAKDQIKALMGSDPIDMTPWVKGLNKMSQTIRTEEAADPQVTNEMSRVINYVSRFLTGDSEEKLAGKMVQGKVEPIDVNKLKRKLSLWSKAGDNSLKTPEAKDFVTKLISQMEQNPELAGASLEVPQGFSALKPLLEQNVEGLGGINQRISSIKKASDIMPSLTEIMNAEKATQSGTSALGSLEKFFSTAPDDLFAGKKEGLTQLAKATDIANKMRAPGLGHGVFGSSVRGGTLTGFNMAGTALRGLYNMAPEQLQTLSTKVAQTGGETGKKLSMMINAAAEKDNVGRNALFFAIQQNPEYRRILNNATGNEEPEPKK